MVGAIFYNVFSENAREFSIMLLADKHGNNLN